MNTLKSLGSGLAGAIALNLINESARHLISGAPRMDKVGMNSMAKAFLKAGAQPPQGKNLYWTALAGDILANTMYYGLVGAGKGKNRWVQGVVLGTAAGISSTILPNLMNVDTSQNQNPRARLMTIGWYLAAGIVAAAVASALKRK